MGRRHRVETIQVEAGYMGVCSCRARGPVESSRSLAGDWEIGHLRTVERVKAHLRGTPTLASTYAYYREMENDRSVSSRERAQWKILADGLEHRLGIPGQDVSMFEEA